MKLVGPDLEHADYVHQIDFYLPRGGVIHYARGANNTYSTPGA